MWNLGPSNSTVFLQPLFISPYQGSGWNVPPTFFFTFGMNWGIIQLQDMPDQKHQPERNSIYDFRQLFS